MSNLQASTQSTVPYVVRTSSYKFRCLYLYDAKDVVVVVVVVSFTELKSATCTWPISMASRLKLVKLI